MTQEEMGNIILGVQNTLTEMQQEDKKRDKMLLKMQEDISVLKEDVSVLKEDVSGLKEDVSGLKEDVSVLKEESKSFSRSIAVIEHDHGGNIQAVLDVISEYPNKFESINKRFESNEEELDNHTFRILNLESKASNC